MTTVSSVPAAALAGRRALITGAARGMGLAHTQHLADLGAHVALVDIDATENQAAARHIGGRGGQAIAITADITDRATAERIIRHAAAELGGLDILVHNAGRMYSLTGLENTDDEDFRALHDSDGSPDTPK
jgi:NAD(P)-dependent dehydrogenase (short-subunit alcohol dehydrogenase family)